MSSATQVFTPGTGLNLDGRRHSEESASSRNASGSARPQMRSQNGVITFDGMGSEGAPIRRAKSLRTGSQAEKQKRLSMNLDIKPNSSSAKKGTVKWTSEGMVDVSQYRGRGSVASTTAALPTSKFQPLKPHTEKDDEADDEGDTREPVRRTSRTNSDLPESLTRSNSAMSFNSVAIRKTLSDGLQRVKSISSKKTEGDEDKSSRTGAYVTYRDDDGDWRRHSIRRHSLQVEPCDYTFKIMLIGDSCVGKTCLMTRFKDGTFLSGTFISTVGMDFRNKVVTVDGSKVKLQIWDTAGQERFRSVTHAYYRDAHALLLLYDVTNKGSFDNTRAWLAEVHEYAQDDVVIMLIGNKGDVPDRVLRREDGERLAREYNVAFMETSAKTGTNVDLAFMAVARQLKARKSNNPDERKFNVADYVRKEDQSNSCLC